LTFLEPSPYRNARVIAFGASGFIGRWVCRALTAAGADLVAVVRNRSDASRRLDRYGVRSTIIEADLDDANVVEEICRTVRPSVTFNLAGYGVDPSERDEATAFRINADLVGRLATAIAEHLDPAWPGQHFIHVGSALEYGAITGVAAENTPPRPNTLYGRSKLQGTALLEAACRGRELRATTARLFMVYGAGEHSGRLLPELIRAASDQAPLPLTRGEQRRDFTYVEDAADGLLRLGLLDVSGGLTVNLATGRLTPVREVVETAARILGVSHDRLAFGALPTRPDEMTGITGVSISLLRQLTDWSPPTTVEGGISRTLRRRQELTAGV
jgi:nucleoside-diphosphate-sugar epimerase